MPILTQDIKLLKSDTFTDSDTGGGRKVKQEIVNGASNNMFEDISTIDTINGAVNIRKVFPSIENQTNEPGLGAHVIVSRVAGDTLQDMILMGSDANARRPAMTSALESYLNEGAKSPFTLYGNAFAGSKVINMFMHPKNALPQIGDVLILKSGASTDYFSIDSLESSLVTFVDSNGEYERVIINIISRQAIENTYIGNNMARDTPLSPTTSILFSAVTNSAKYYGSKKLTSPASIGSSVMNVTSIFGQIVPSTRTDTPIVNQNISNIDNKIAAAALTPITRNIQIYANNPTQKKFYMGTPITPGTATMSGAYTIEGVNIKAGGDVVGIIDYAEGTITCVLNSILGDMTYKPGAAVGDSVKSFSKPVTINNRSLVYVLQLPTIPTAGTIRVRYRSLGKWYTLTDNGYGGLTGIGNGQILYEARNISVTLAALPDVGSGIVVSYTNSIGITPLGNNTAFSARHIFILPKNISYLNANVSISYTDVNNNTQTLTVGANGNITGSITGTLDKARGLVILNYSANSMKYGTNTIFSITELTKKTYTTSALGRDGNNRINIVLPDTNIQPGSVKLTYETTVVLPNDSTATTVNRSFSNTFGVHTPVAFAGATYTNHKFNFIF